MEAEGDLQKKPAPREKFTVSESAKKPSAETDALTDDVKKRRVSITTAARLRVAVLALSIVTVLVLIVLGSVTLAYSVLDHSAASFAFALTAILDCLSSAVVIWRFASPAALYSADKERAACIALAILFIVSGITVITRSVIAICRDDEASESDVIWILALVNTISCLTLASAKFFVAFKLESVSVATDAVNSSIGFVLALAALVSDLVYQEHHSVWYIDPVLGICCSIGFFIYAIWLLVHAYREKQATSYEAMK